MKDKWKHRPKGLFVAWGGVQLTGCILLLSALLQVMQNRQVINIPMTEMYSDRAWRAEENVWYLDQNMVDTPGETVYMLYGPYTVLPAGSYTITVDYNANAEGMHNHFFMINSEEVPSAVVADEQFVLYKQNSHQSYDFRLTRQIPDFELLFSYVGEDYLQINSISLIRNTQCERMLLFLWVLFCALIDLFLLCWKWIKGHLYEIVAVGVITLLASLPVIKPGLYAFADTPFHMLRIEGLAEGLKEGMFPVKLQSIWLYGYGYPVSVCYGDLLLYIPAILRLFGFSMIFVYKTYLVMINMLTCTISYICFRKILSLEQAALDWKIAMMGSLVYTTAAYRLFLIYDQTMVGQYTAMAFLPLVVYGVHKIYRQQEQATLYDSFKASIPLALGMSALILSHILTVEMACVFLVLTALILWKKTFSVRVLREYGMAILICTFINLWFIVPFLDYYLSVDMVVKSAPYSASGIQASGQTLETICSFFKDNPFTPGIVLLSSMVIWLFFYKNKDKQGQVYFVLSAVAIWMSTRYFPWDFFETYVPGGKIVCMVQFPHRYLVMQVLFLTLILCKNILFIRERLSGKIPYLAQGAIFCVSIIAAITTCFYAIKYIHANEGYKPLDGMNIRSDRIVGEEYLRSGTDVEALDGQLHTDGMILVPDMQKRGSHMDIACVTGDVAAAVELPILNYKGYRAFDDAGNRFSITDGEQNTVRITIPAGYAGVIHVDYCEPWYWRLAEIISMLSIVGLIGSMVTLYKRQDLKYEGCKMVS